MLEKRRCDINFIMGHSMCNKRVLFEYYSSISRVKRAHIKVLHASVCSDNKTLITGVKRTLHRRLFDSRFPYEYPLTRKFVLSLFSRFRIKWTFKRYFPLSIIKTNRSTAMRLIR